MKSRLSLLPTVAPATLYLSVLILATTNGLPASEDDARGLAHITGNEGATGWTVKLKDAVGFLC